MRARHVTMNALLPALAVAAMPVTIFCFAYSFLPGPLEILTVYAVWFGLAFVRWRTITHNLPRALPLFALAVFGTLSVVWSANPAASLRAGIQYGTTIFVAVAAARLLTVRQLTLGLVLTAFPVIAFSAVFGHYSYDAIDGSYTFVGAFGSKNQLGLHASVYLAATAALLLQRGRNLAEAIVALAAAGVSALALVQSDSATSMITVAPVLVLCVLGRVIVPMNQTQRLMLFTIGLILAIGLISVAVEAGFFDRVLAVFGKDTTLTGRTYLWSEGVAAGMRNPGLGMGYNAFWTQGFSHAERLWEEFYIDSRTGFHFHSTYIEVFVGLGFPGLALVSALALTAVIAPLLALLSRRADEGMVFLFALALMFLARSFVEIDFLNTYTLGSFLLYFIILKSADRLLDRYPATQPEAAGWRAPVAGGQDVGAARRSAS